MARINIEDSLYSDPRFKILIALIGEESTAIGKLVLAWRTAQAYWIKDELIPHRFWQILKLDELIEAGLAEDREGGIYVCGIEEQFAWLKQKQEAGKKGGVASGESRRKRSENEALVKHSSSESEAGGSVGSVSLKQNASGAKPLSLPLSLPLSTTTTTDFKIPSDILETIKIQYGYPDELIEDVRKDAELKFISRTEKEKDWKRFVAHYFANEKDKIRNRIIDQGKTKKTNLNGNSEALEMSERIYSTVKSFGLHEYQKMLTKLSDKEKLALEKFGSVRDIHENQMVEQVKKRLRDACVQAENENKKAG